MGAAAIRNAGSVLVLTDSGISFLQSMRPFIEGMTPIICAWGTWWIPLLLLLGIWKHVVRRIPLTYTSALWSLVFPLGMYVDRAHFVAVPRRRVSMTARTRGRKGGALRRPPG